MNEARVRAEGRGLVRVLEIENRAKRNALDFRALDELEPACEEAARDRVPCVLLRGAGEDAFSSGFDLDEIALTSRRGERPERTLAVDDHIIIRTCNGRGNCMVGKDNCCTAATIPSAVHTARCASSSWATG